MGYASSLLTSQSPLLLILVFLLPSLPALIGRFQRRNAPRPLSPPIKRQTTRLAALLGINTLLHLFRIFKPPFNVFRAYNLEITASVDTLQRYLKHHYYRALLIQKGQVSAGYTGQSTQELDRLLNKLSNLDYRLLYARYGHEAMAKCVWCSSYDDYAVASLHRVLTPYIWCAAVIGVLGWNVVLGNHATGHSKRWRGAFGTGLVVLAGMEVGGRYISDLRVVDGACPQLDAQLHTIRTLLLALVPIIYTFLPPAPPNSSDTILHLASILPKLSETSNLLRLSALARTAISSDRTLRDMSTAAHRRGVAGRDAARADTHVQAAAERVGLGEGGEGRIQAGNWVKERWKALVKLNTSHEASQ